MKKILFKNIFSGPDLVFIVLCYMWLPIFYAMAVTIVYAYAMDVLQAKGYLE